MIRRGISLPEKLAKGSANVKDSTRYIHNISRSYPQRVSLRSPWLCEINGHESHDRGIAILDGGKHGKRIEADRESALERDNNEAIFFFILQLRIADQRRRRYTRDEIGDEGEYEEEI